MGELELVGLTAAVFVVAALYSCVGHAGASGYIAVMALFGILPAVFRPTALVLNIIVSVLASIQFYRAGYFSWRLFWPFAALSVPFAFLGGRLSLPGSIYQPLIAMVLFFSSVRLFMRESSTRKSVHLPPLLLSLGIGMTLGFLAGLTGVGGGIFLSPLLLLMGWAEVRQTAAVSALFIFVNSLSGLLGHVSSLQAVPGFALQLAIAAVLGGVIGSYFGSRRLPVIAIRRILGVVLLIAGLKLIFV